jgi:imidazolonepropionase-like amidohydrolase
VSGALVLVLGAAVFAQEPEDSFAVTHLRILTVTRGEIDSGTILVRGQKFAEVGKDVRIPEGTRTLDARGQVAFPGFVNPVSRIGTRDQSGGGTAPTPLHLAYDEIDPTSEAFAQARRSGFLVFGVSPSGGPVGGQGAILWPLELATKDRMMIERTGFLRLTMHSNTSTKEALRQSLEAARKTIESEKKAPPPKPDERPSPVVRMLRGEWPALVWVGTAGDILHFYQILDSFPEFKPRVTLVAPPEAYKAAAFLGERKARLILRPELAFLPMTRDRVNPAAELSRAGVTLALAPVSDTLEAFEEHLLKVAELVKFGLPRDIALGALTLAPAQMLGIEKRAGSIEAGKDANFLLFDQDPLSPQAHLRKVFLLGKAVYSEDEPR